jgi:hypothetical protein
VRKKIKLTSREEANAIVAYAIRNTFLEDLHAGKSLPEKYLRGYSRISDAEMKKLMIEICDKMEILVRMRKEKPKLYPKCLLAYGLIYCREWKGQNPKRAQHIFGIKPLA